MADNLKWTLLEFSGRLITDAGAETAESVAASRGWLDEQGKPTRAGLDVARAFADQQKTRSAFRIG